MVKQAVKYNIIKSNISGRLWRGRRWWRRLRLSVTAHKQLHSFLSVKRPNRFTQREFFWVLFQLVPTTSGLHKQPRNIN
jgi:hypothetical protein